MGWLSKVVWWILEMLHLAGPSHGSTKDAEKWVNERERMSGKDSDIDGKD